MMISHGLGWMHVAGSRSCCLLCHCAASRDGGVLNKGEKIESNYLQVSKDDREEKSKGRARLSYPGHFGSASGCDTIRGGDFGVRMENHALTALHSPPGNIRA